MSDDPKRISAPHDIPTPRDPHPGPPPLPPGPAATQPPAPPQRPPAGVTSALLDRVSSLETSVKHILEIQSQEREGLIGWRGQVNDQLSSIAGRIRRVDEKFDDAMRGVKTHAAGEHRERTSIQVDVSEQRKLVEAQAAREAARDVQIRWLIKAVTWRTAALALAYVIVQRVLVHL